MFNFHITLALALTTLRDLVREFGEDHLGTLDQGGCAYVDEYAQAHDLKSSCIVGKCFDRWGILRVLLATPNACGVTVKSLGVAQAGAFGGDLRRHLDEVWGITFDDEAFTLLNRAQVNQDGSAPWGQAVESAARYIEQERGYTPPAATAVERLLNQSGEGLAEWERELLGA
jgi:hypothetical protein